MTMLNSRYYAFVDFICKKQLVTNSEQTRANRMLVNVCVLTSLVALFYIPAAGLIGFETAIYFMAISFCIHFLTLLLFRFGLSHRICGNLYVFNNAFIAIAPCVYYSGGFVSPAAPWFALIGINTLLLFGLTKNTFVWFAITLLTVAALGLAEVRGFAFPVNYNRDFFNLFLLLCVIGLSVIIFLVTSVFANTTQNALHTLTVYNIKIEQEKKRSEELLLNILPAVIADRLRNGEQPIADHFSQASIVFIDIVNFTTFSASNDPKGVVEMLNDIFTHIDKICARYELEKIKTIGDSYMAASGIPVSQTDHAVRAFRFAKDVLKELDNYHTPNNEKIQFRIGLNCGPVIAGVIGERKFIYDLWGDAVNTAARMESNGVINKIHCTNHFKEALIQQDVNIDNFVDRGILEIKGKGKMRTWLAS
jgi:class 3 adenylate cyclase